MPAAEDWQPRLHLDADASRRDLLRELRARGHDVTRTPSEWMPLEASDRDQLLGATAQGRAIFTFNIADFVTLARRYPAHGGVVLAEQRGWSLGELVISLDRFLREVSETEVRGQVLWLNRWRQR
jgi:hypothetical protein